MKKTAKKTPPLRGKDVMRFKQDEGLRQLAGFINGQVAELDKKKPAYGPDDDEFWGQPDQTTSPAFDAFIGEIRTIFGKSVSKGYGPMQPDDPNPLYNFMLTFFSNDHAFGEIIYKAIRYRNKRNPEDLVKIAAWAWLVWMHHWKQEGELGNRG